jgi:hypothetical protein
LIAYSYCFSEELSLESFGDESILQVADWDRLLTLDATAVRLFSLLQRNLGTKPFSRNSLSRLLREHYDLSNAEADAEMASILAFGLKQGIVLKK